MDLAMVTLGVSKDTADNIVNPPLYKRNPNMKSYWSASCANGGCLIHHGLGLGLRPRTTDRVRHHNLLSNASDHGPSPTSEATSSVCDFFGRTESEVKGRTESVVRVRRPLSNAQTTDRVRGLSLSLWSEIFANSPLGYFEYKKEVWHSVDDFRRDYDLKYDGRLGEMGNFVGRQSPSYDTVLEYMTTSF
ncbi:hypothetical protein LXL04_011911 [Taraxacum kok-saghyz]